MKNHNTIAEKIFQQHGLGFDGAVRAGGWTNAVWLNGGAVLRLSNERGNDRIRREAERSKSFPASVGYPEIIDAGVTDGYEWSLAKRVQGIVLSDVWGGLSWLEKVAAVKQILTIMNAVHTVDVCKVERLTLRRSWYNAFARDNSLSEFNGYIKRDLFTPAQGRVLIDTLERFYTALDRVTPVFCHGDITTDNLLWHDGNIVSLLDFEYSATAPRLLDVHSLVNLALTQYDEAADKEIILFNSKQPEIRQYAGDMIALFKPFLASQSEKDLFLGDNVLFRQRFFEFWLEKPEGGVENCDAYQKLLSFSDGSGGYLSALL